MSALLVAFVVVLLAAAVQAVTGFGFALVAVPLVALATDPRTAVVGAGLAGLGMSLAVTMRERAHVRWRTTGLLLATAVAGMPLGLLLLRSASDQVLTALIAACALGGTALVWRRARLRTAGPVALSAVGVLVGTLSTATGTNGPPMVAAFQAMGYDARTFRATIAAVFSGTGTASVAGFFMAGVVTSDGLWIGAVGTPAMVLGWLLGDRLFRRLDADRFRGVVLAALVVTSVVTFARAVLS